MVEESKRSKQKFQVLEVLSKSATTQVVKVRSKESGQVFALKRTSMALLVPEQRAQVKRESKILEALAHPNIIKFEHSFKDRQDNWNLVMEFAEKGSLSDEISMRNNHHCPYKEDELSNYIAQICLAVKHLHDRNVIHRKIKAANIFLSKHNQVKLGDFGTSKVLFETNEKSQTMNDH